MFSPTRSSATRWRRSVAASGVIVTLGAALAVVVWEPWHGPVILSLSTGHGINAGNLLVVPLVALAVFIYGVGSLRLRPAWGSASRESSRRWVGPTSAIVFGVALVAAAAIDVTDRGSLVPAGGGTFDGTLQNIAGRSGSPVRAWSYIALTYDGARLRLFVDGSQVSSHATTGTIQATEHPLWLGGNQPFGEYFEGAIDEARVYNRALDEAEIRADMETPVLADSPARGPAGVPAGAAVPVPANGLVGAYSFDTGWGASVSDDSGNGNVGRISGATWTTRGRYGSALSFDGVDDRVRVPASASLDLESALTLSAWVRPAASQGGWRTILYRQRDIFFLDAGASLEGVSGRVDDLLAASVVAAAAGFSVVLVRSRGRWLGRRPRAWWVAAGLLLVGFVLDAVAAPTATLFGPVLLAAWFAASSGDRAEAAAGWLVAAGLTAVTAASLADVEGLGSWMRRDDGGLARSAALGVTLLVIGVVMLRSATRAQVE